MTRKLVDRRTNERLNAEFIIFMVLIGLAFGLGAWIWSGT